MVDEEGFTTIKRRNQPIPKRPPDFSTLQEVEQQANADDMQTTSPPPRNTPQAAPIVSPHYQALPTPTKNHSNHLSAAQTHQALQDPHVTTNTVSSTPHELPYLGSFNRDCPNFVGYGTSGGTPQLSCKPCDPSPGEEAQHQTRKDSTQPLSLHFSTQHLDEPTQPFLILDFDLNAAADDVENSRPFTGGANASPLSARSSSC